MKQRCTFNKARDKGVVLVGLAPDITDMINTHQIKDVAADVVYNEIHEIAEVGIRINDDFDAIMVSRAMKAGLQANKGTGSTQPAGSTAPVSNPAPANE